VFKIIFTICLVAFAVTGAAYAFPQLVIINQAVVAPQILQFVSSSPVDNQELSAPPQVITVTFSENIHPDKSTLTVFDPYNNPLNDGRATVTATAMSVRMPALGAGYTGTYRAEWRAQCLCSEGRELSGAIHFAIR